MGTRVVRTEEKQETVVQKVFTVEDTIQAAMGLKGEYETIASQLSDKLIVELVDEGTKLDVEQKRLVKRVSVIKDVLKAAARIKETHAFDGKYGEATISDSSSSSMKATDLVKVLKSLGKQKLFNDLVNVKIGEVKKYFGTEVIGQFIKITSEKFASISFKEKKR